MVRRKDSKQKMRRKPKTLSTEVVVPLTRAQVAQRRNGSFEPWMCEVAKDMCGKLGARLIDLAEHFGVCPATIDNWIRNRPEFERAVKYGRMECMIKVSGALFHSSIGYSHPAVHIMPNTVKEYDVNGNVTQSHTEPLLVPYIKHYPPNAQAAIKYLTILGRELGWSEITKVNMDVNHSGDINIHKIAELSMENLSEEAKALLYEVNLKQLNDVQVN